MSSFVALTISIILSTVKSETVSANWVLNSFAGGNDNVWVETFINDLWVSNDGTCYTTCIWDEGGHPGSIWKNGQLQGILQLNQNQFGGLAVTGYYDQTKQENVIFTGNGGGGSVSDKIFKFHGNGSAYNYDNSNSNTFNPSSSSINTTVYGLAANSQYLAVSDPNNDRIIIYDSSTGNYKSEFKFQRPSDIAMDSNGNLWIIQASYSFAGYPMQVPAKYYGPSTVLKYSINGNYLGVNISEIDQPSSLNMQYLSSGEERLLITDFGKTQQVYAYTGLNTTIKQAFTFGKSTYNQGSSSGDMTKDPTVFYRLAAVGGDSDGNLYVNLGGPYPRGDFTPAGTDLRSFDKNGNLNWSIFGKAFVIMGDVDPNDPTMYYTGYDLFKYDSGSNQWIFQAITHNRFAYPQDSRVLQDGVYYPYEVPQNIWARRLSNGDLYLFMNFMAGDQGSVRIYRFDADNSGYIAIPSARWAVSDGGPYPPYQPANGVEYVWHDANGDGMYQANEYITDSVQEEPFHDGVWADKDGSLWAGYRNHGLRRLKMTGFDDHKNPIYTFTPRDWFDPPSPVTDVHFVRYIVDDDRMFIAGQSEQNHANDDEPGQVWSMFRYDNWFNISGKLSYKWQTSSDHYDIVDNSQSFDVYNEYLFTIGIKEDHQVRVWSVDDGSLVTTIQPPSIFGDTDNMGWCDIWDSSIRANQFKNGSYIIFVEEDARNKNIQYTYTP